MGFRKVLLITGLCLIVAGGGLSAVSYALLGFNPAKLSLANMVTEELKIDEAFHDIRIDASVGEFHIYPSGNDCCHVEYYLPEDTEYSASVVKEQLNISVGKVEHTAFYGLGISGPKVSLYLPEKEYGKLSAKLTYGNVELPEGFSFSEADFDLDVGNLDCSSRVTDSLSARLTTGNVELKNVVLSGNLDISCTTGNVELEDCDAASISIEVTTGDVDATLRTPKRFDASTTVGDVDVPPSGDGGECRIRITTGSIDIELSEE